MPSKREAARRQARYYLGILRNVNEHYKQGGENVPQVMAQLDMDWLQIQQGQAHAASYAEEDAVATILCVAYSRTGPNMLHLRQAPTERIRWLEQALASIQQLKHHLTEKRTD